jgi:hypothetical protein
MPFILDVPPSEMRDEKRHQISTPEDERMTGQNGAFVLREPNLH